MRITKHTVANDGVRMRINFEHNGLHYSLNETEDIDDYVICTVLNCKEDSHRGNVWWNEWIISPSLSPRKHGQTFSQTDYFEIYELVKPYL